MKYTLKNAEGTELDSRSDKTKAIELASAKARELQTTVTVVTDKGTEVFTAKPRKAQKKTPRFTRVDTKELTLAEGVRLPREPWVAAYVRPRVNLALFRKVGQPDADGKREIAYLVFNASDGTKIEVNSTREAGVLFRDATAAKKSELAAAA